MLGIDFAGYEKSRDFLCRATVENIAMAKNDILVAIEERVKFVELLLSLKEHVRELQPAAEPGPGGKLDHPTRHISGHCTYLMLTCFDMLGQPAKWVDFSAWLAGSAYKAERQEVVDKLGVSADPVAAAKALLANYNKRYGVKSSFYRFFDLLEDQERADLLQSVLVQRWSAKAGLQSASQTLNFEKSKEAMFGIRNGFTHRGQVTASVYPEFLKFHGEMRFADIGQGRLQGGYSPVLSVNSGDTVNDISVRDWPNALLHAVRSAHARLRSEQTEA